MSSCKEPTQAHIIGVGKKGDELYRHMTIFGHEFDKGGMRSYVKLVRNPLRMHHTERPFFTRCMVRHNERRRQTHENSTERPSQKV